MSVSTPRVADLLRLRCIPGKDPPCKWQELHEALREEWVELRQTVEYSLQDHFQRQEFLMNQYALRIEDAVAGPSGEESSRTTEPFKRGNSAPAFVDPLSKEDAKSIKTSALLDSFEPVKMEPVNGVKASKTAESPAFSNTSADVVLSADIGNRGGDSPSPSPSMKRVTSSESNLGRDIDRVMSPTDLTHLEMDEEHPHVPRGTPSHRVTHKLPNTQRFSIATVEGMDSQCLMDTYQQRRLMSMRVGEVRKICGEKFWSYCGHGVVWWLELRPPTPTGRLARCVMSDWFEVISAFIVAANCLVIVVTTNEEASIVDEDKSLAMRVANGVFVAFYTLELIAKLAVHKHWFFCNADMTWNIFDMLLVVLALTDFLMAEATVTMSHMRTVWSSFRIFRMSRILRMVRFVRYFSQLRLLLNSLIGSLFSLFWSIIMLMFMFVIFAIVFVQGATIALIDHEVTFSEEEKRDVQEHFGSMMTAMLTLFKATTGGDDWINFYRPVELTGTLHTALFLFFIAFAQFALLNIIMGIFVENAMKLAQPDRETVAMAQRKADLKQADELRRLCGHFAFAIGDNLYISEERFMKELRDDQFKACLTLLGLDIKHSSLFFDIICSEYPRDKVPIDAFVAGAMRLKGFATSLDLQTLLFGTKTIHENQIQFFSAMDGHLSKILSKMDRHSEVLEKRLSRLIPLG